MALPIPALAGLDEEMDGMFADMINATPGGFYETQRRGVIAGGGLSARNKIVHPQLVSFVPPSVKGGCGGIDLFMGSFSYINGTQITQMLRSVAQGAVGYAFQLAIEGMCPTCAQVMTKLQKDIQTINGLMKDSCNFSKQLVDGTGLTAWHDKKMNDAADLNTQKGFLSDYFESKEQSNPIDKAVANGSSDDVTGNVVHEALASSSVKDWFVSGDSQLERVLMSLTGTVVMSHSAMPDGKEGPVYGYRRPTIDTQDFIQGGELEIYRCADDECLLEGADPTEKVGVKGMRDRVAAMLFGTGTSQYDTGGIVRKLANREGGEGFGADEEKFLKTASPGILGLLNRVSAQPGSAALVGQQMVGVVATSLTNALVDEMLRAVRDSVAVTGKSLDTKMLDIIRERQQEIAEQKLLDAQAMESVTHLLDIQANLERALRPAKPGKG